MYSNIKRILDSDKDLPAEPEWKIQDGNDFVRLVSPIDIYGVTQQGLQFTVTANLEMLDMRVAFQFVYSPSVSQTKGFPIIRFDWKPSTAHNNNGIGPDGYRFINIEGSHIHPFNLNWNPSTTQMRRGNLPVAVPIVPEPGSFNDALDFVEKKFKIKGVKSLPQPPWSPKLL